MIRIKKTLNSTSSKSSLSLHAISGQERKKENFVEEMGKIYTTPNSKVLNGPQKSAQQPERGLRVNQIMDKNEGPEFIRSETILSTLIRKDLDYPQQQKTLKRVSSLTTSLKGLSKLSQAECMVAMGSPPKPFTNIRRPRPIPTPRSISPSISSGSSYAGSPNQMPITARSITPIASPVCHNALALCAELDIDTLTLNHHGALKRGIDLEGIALCEKNGIHLPELQKYNAVRRDIDIKGISMCKANGVDIEVLHKMNAIEPNVDISGIAICEATGIDIYALQDYGFIEPGRSLRSIALLKQQGYDMEQIFMMNPGFDCIT